MISRVSGLRLAALTAVIVLGARASDSYGELRGVARDGRGHGVAEAYVTVHNVDHNFDRNVVTEADGSYLLNDLPDGGYTVSIERYEYDSPKPSPVTVTAGGQQALDLMLAPKPLKPRSWREKLLRNPAHT